MLTLNVQLKIDQNPSLKEKLDRLIIKTAINAKLAFGMGLDNPIEEDREQLANELSKQYRKSPVYLKVKVFDKDNIWTCDLAEMHPDNLGK